MLELTAVPGSHRMGWPNNCRADTINVQKTRSDEVNFPKIIKVQLKIDNENFRLNKEKIYS